MESKTKSIHPEDIKNVKRMEKEVRSLDYKLETFAKKYGISNRKAFETICMKPILVITGRCFSMAEHDKIHDKLSNQMPDYHILVINGFNRDGIKTEVFNPKDIPEIELSKLKKIVMDGVLNK